VLRRVLGLARVWRGAAQRQTLVIALAATAGAELQMGLRSGDCQPGRAQPDGHDI
jgi:hypothetical protein